MAQWNKIVFIHIVFSSFCCCKDNYIVVTTKQGDIEGKIINVGQGANTQFLSQFFAIPYAAPPIGSLRFLPPVTQPPWKNLRKFVKNSALCIQECLHCGLKKRQSEDCLYLDVFSPNICKYTVPTKNGLICKNSLLKNFLQQGICRGCVIYAKQTCAGKI